MDLNINGNPGTGNSFPEIRVEIHQDIQIGSVGQYINQAEKVEYGFGRQKDKAEPDGPGKSPVDTRETPPVHDWIMRYVSCLIGQVADRWLSRYERLWEGILALDAVAARVYDRGKQRHTAFNRNLVANIIHLLGSFKEERLRVYKDYNAALLTERLEGDKDHSVRAALGQDPPEAIRDSVSRFVENFLLPEP